MGYHQQNSWESSTKKKKIINSPSDLKQNKLNQTERRLSLFKPRLTYVNSPESPTRSPTMIRIERLSETSSIELVNQDHSSPDLEISTIYSSSTGAYSKRYCRYVTYPQVSQRSTSSFSDNYSEGDGTTTDTECSFSNLEASSHYSRRSGDYSQRIKRYDVSCHQVSTKSKSKFSNSSSNLEVSSLYSSSSTTGDQSQRIKGYVSYPQVSPKSISNFLDFSPAQGLNQSRRSLSCNLEDSIH